MFTAVNAPNPRPRGISIRRLVRREEIWFGIAFPILVIAAVAAPLIPIALDLSSGSRDLTAFVCCAGIPAMILFGILAVGTGNYFAPHMTSRQLDQLCAFGRVDEVLRQVDGDLADLSHAWVRGSLKAADLGGWPDCWIVTDRWIAKVKRHDLFLLPLAEIAWLYKRLVPRPGLLSRHRFYYGLRFTLVNHPQRYVELNSELDLDDMIEQIALRRPDALFGYSGELLDLARKGKEALLAEVARRRDRYALLSEDDRAEWLDARVAEGQNSACRVDPVTGERPPEVQL